jgi:hypothetical protein
MTKNDVAFNLSILDVFVGDDGTGYGIPQPSSGSTDYVAIRSTNGSTIHHLFGTDGSYHNGGSIIFPDGSVQTTAFTLPNIVTTTGELTLGQTGDTYGPIYLRIRNRDYANGMILDASSSTVSLADLIFQTNVTTGVLRFNTTNSLVMPTGDGHEFLICTDGFTPRVAINNTGMYITPSTVSTNTTSGALVVSGGVGIAGDVYAGSVNVGNNDLTIASNTIGVNSGELTVNNTTVTGGGGSYTMGNPSDWLTPVTTIAAALDQIASRLKALNG